ncbi:MAG: molybdenum cofactor guanylyltransferase [Acetomicrobium sp.]
MDLEAKEDALSGITAVILAGGKGSRVGRNKAFIKLGHTYLLELVLQNMNKIFDNIIIVTSRCDYDRILSIHSSIPSCYHINVICDSDAGQGPLLGLLEALRVSKKEWLFLAGCDMPFINRSLVKHIYGLKNENSQAVVPRFKGFWSLCMPFITVLV